MVKVIHRKVTNNIFHTQISVQEKRIIPKSPLTNKQTPLLTAADMTGTELRSLARVYINMV